MVPKCLKKRNKQNMQQFILYHFFVYPRIRHDRRVKCFNRLVPHCHCLNDYNVITVCFQVDNENYPMTAHLVCIDTVQNGAKFNILLCEADSV